MTTTPILVWIRRDLRLTDHAALSAAAESGRPVIPVFLCDEAIEPLGAAPKWRFGLGLAAFAKRLEAIGSRLILRRGPAQAALQGLVQDTGAGAVYWQRSYDPQQQARDTAIKSALKDAGLTVKSFPGHLLFEPWTVQTKTGGFYRVYSPMWKAVRNVEVSAALPVPAGLAAPNTWPGSERLEDWQLGSAMQRGAAIVAPYPRVGEDAAQAKLQTFLDGPITHYQAQRDFPGVPATSRLSENLTYGEISPRTVWHAGRDALIDGAAGAETFLKELVWREFAYHLLHHTPHIATANWRPEWDAFPWNCDETDDVRAWKQGRTGVEFVDAAMREMYVTGMMHNRARMIVGSYLTKHLLSHWKIGLRWFEQCLIDWDPASNAMGWQWVAGSGPDATPYFRVFNPVTQADKFDADRAYRRAWIAEGSGTPTATAIRYFDAIPLAWGLSPDMAYPTPIVSAEEGRRRALAAYAAR